MATPFSGRSDPTGPTEPSSGPQQPNWSQPLRKKPSASGGGTQWAGFGPPPGDDEESQRLRAEWRNAQVREAFPTLREALHNIGQQWRTNPEIQQVMRRVYEHHDKAEYFRRAGMGAAIRHALGAPQSYEHLQYYMQRTRTPRQVGLNPPPLHAYYTPQRGEPRAPQQP
jgi:hypothetical protein